jgi:hypothetical protein
MMHMGVDVYAISRDHQQDLESELSSMGLNSNLRRCKINVWKGTFSYCTNMAICDFQWDDPVPIKTVKEWAIKARKVANDTDTCFAMESCAKQYNQDIADATLEDVQKVCKYLEICVRHDAQLVVC